jgi:hypothetical protein
MADEEARYDDLMMDVGGPMCFIRMNPDPYLDESGTKRNPPMIRRLQAPAAATVQAAERQRCHNGTAPELLLVRHCLLQEEAC